MKTLHCSWFAMFVLSGCASGLPPQSSSVMSGPPEAKLPAAGGCDAVALRQSVLQQVNAARASGQVCGLAQLPPAVPVGWHAAVAAAASQHTEDMARRGLFDHRGSDGSQVEQRVRREGYQAVAVGETIAGGDYNAGNVVHSWLGSERHCRTLMQPAYTEVGASCFTAPRSDWGTYWTLVMGHRAAVEGSAPARPTTQKATPATRKVRPPMRATKPSSRTTRAAKAPAPRATP